MKIKTISIMLFILFMFSVFSGCPEKVTNSEEIINPKDNKLLYQYKYIKEKGKVSDDDGIYKCIYSKPFAYKLSNNDHTIVTPVNNCKIEKVCKTTKEKLYLDPSGFLLSSTNAKDSCEKAKKDENDFEYWAGGTWTKYESGLTIDKDPYKKDKKKICQYKHVENPGGAASNKDGVFSCKSAWSEPIKKICVDKGDHIKATIVDKNECERVEKICSYTKTIKGQEYKYCLDQSAINLLMSKSDHKDNLNNPAKACTAKLIDKRGHVYWDGTANNTEWGSYTKCIDVSDPFIPGAKKSCQYKHVENPGETSDKDKVFSCDNSEDDIDLLEQKCVDKGDHIKATIVDRANCEEKDIEKACRIGVTDNKKVCWSVYNFNKLVSGSAYDNAKEVCEKATTIKTYKHDGDIKKWKWDKTAIKRDWEWVDRNENECNSYMKEF